MLSYKCEELGILVVSQEESYTSKASFLDLDPIPVYGNALGDWQPNGRRVRRGLYKSDGGIVIHADVNASYNISRKVTPRSYVKGVEGFVVTPVFFPRETHKIANDIR